jgi:hypothetical protein
VFSFLAPCRFRIFQLLLPVYRSKHVEMYETVECPFCGSGVTVGIDTTVEHQTFTTDCDVCCRPFQVEVQCEPGHILVLGVQGG